MPLALAIPRVLQWVAFVGLVFEGFGHDPLDLVVGHRAWGTGAWLVGQSLQPTGGEPVAPGADGGAAHAQPRGHDLVARFVGAGQHDAGAEGETLGALGPAGPLCEHLAFVLGQRQLGLGPCHTASGSSKAVANRR
jgi:hypothetical protein